jgi:hypothetical protein
MTREAAGHSSARFAPRGPAIDGPAEAGHYRDRAPYRRREWGGRERAPARARRRFSSLRERRFAEHPSGLFSDGTQSAFDAGAKRRSTVRLPPSPRGGFGGQRKPDSLQLFASFQFSPIPTSTVSGTFITAADCILSRTMALNSSARAFGTSNSSSSWTVRIMRASG